MRDARKIAATATSDDADMAFVPAGEFLMGSEHAYPEERPARFVEVKEFLIDRFPVTNEQFSRFVAETAYVTVAERGLDPTDFPGIVPEMLVPGSLVFRPRSDLTRWRGILDWWDYVPGASWQFPLGPGTAIKGLERHPVVHVTFEDALAYATWAGKRLPTEAQWECAARGGLHNKMFAWGDDLVPNGQMMANFWFGEFPIKGDASTVVGGTSEVGAYPPNGFGLFDMIGNVWEWTSDWYGSPSLSCCSPSSHEQGTRQVGSKVVKGGSFLCAPNYCRRYRPSARQGQMIDSSTNHIGFRCVKELN